METRPLDPFDDAQMRRFHEIAWRAEKDDGRPWNPMWTYDEMTGRFRSSASDRRTVGVATYDGDRMVGVGWADLSMHDNLHTAWIFVAVEPELRGRGIGAHALEGVLDLAREHGRTQIVTGAGIPFEGREDHPILRWAKAQGFTLANMEVQRNLELPVDDALLDTVAAEAAEKHDGYEILTFNGPLPDELLASWCEHVNQFLLEAPLGDIEAEAEQSTPESVREHDLEHEKVGRTVYHAVAVKDGQVVANSDLAVPHEGDEAHQWGTLVHRDHRGHRLGAAVKVANLKALQAGHPQVPRVVTTNAETNQWMVAINERLGFRQVAVVPVLKRVL